MKGGKKRAAFGLTVLVLSAVFATVVLLALAVPTATDFGIDDARGYQNTYVLVPVNITNAQNGPIAGIGFNISYNKSVINVVGIQAGSLASDWDFSTGYANYSWGTAVAIVFNGSGTEIGDGSRGPTVILNFSVVGAPGATSPMNITDIQLSDLSGNVGTAPAKNGTFTISKIFDTEAPTNPYPSIFGLHNGTIKPDVTIAVSKLYTYSCEGTGGHTEYARIWNETLDVNATWNGYVGNGHNISFNEPFMLVAGEMYNYSFRTGSYPQIHHTDALLTANGWINCSRFVDTNDKKYTDWIPAINLGA
ncbi:MAG: hypothetical protein KAT65_11505 [Methanophagales archaeon]|nr:hypothetical protein [Methanophagales archaeon]